MGYRADQQPDGTWTIYDVPVFATCVDARKVKDPAKDKPFVFDGPWLAKALEIAQQREREGYLAPLHVRHHEQGASQDEVQAAGHFRLKRVGTMSYEGQSRPTLFADLVSVPQNVFEAIKRGALPYRSVEIHRAMRELDSIALLDHEVPFFRFELLRVTDARPLREGAAASMAHGELALTFAQGVTMLHFNDKGQGVAFNDKPAPGAPAASNPAEDMAVRFAAALATAMQPIYEKLGLAPGQKPAAAPGAAPTPPVAQVPDRPVEVAMSAEARERMAKLEGEITAMRAQNEATARESRVNDRASRLRAGGYAETIVSAFTAKAKAEGEAVAMAFADGLSQHRPATPPPAWGGELPRGAGMSEDPPEVAKFKDQPEKLGAARRFAAMHAALKATGSTSRTLKDFLDANLADDLVSFRAS